MRIPRFWQHDTVEGTDERGHRHQAHGWGWSESSVEEAKSRANAAATRVLGWLLNEGATDEPDRYTYGTRLPREEIVQEFSGDAPAYVSRNAYGALILNTENLMFLDVDFPPRPNRQPWGMIRRLLGRPPESTRADTVLSVIRTTADNYRRLGIRVYRTHSGYRLMVTNERLSSDSTLAQELLRQFNSDPNYIRLCQAQQCFRARLTPKPWRCHLDVPPVRFPFDDANCESTYRQWEKDYSRGVNGYSTCHFVKTLGPEVILNEFSELVKLHDRLSNIQAAARLA